MSDTLIVLHTAIAIIAIVLSGDQSSRSFFATTSRSRPLAASVHLFGRRAFSQLRSSAIAAR
jgi:hypothetical protein